MIKTVLDLATWCKDNNATIDLNLQKQCWHLAITMGDGTVFRTKSPKTVDGGPTFDEFVNDCVNRAAAEMGLRA